MAYQFDDASNQSIDYGDVTFMDAATQISGHAWVNLDDIAADHAIFAKINAGLTEGWSLWADLTATGGFDRSYSAWCDTTGGAASWITSATDTATPGTWQSVGFTLNFGVAGSPVLWVDGSDVSAGGSPGMENHASMPNIADSLLVGDSGFFNEMDGGIAEPAIWLGRILSAAEFKGLANGRSAEFYRQGLVWYDRLVRTTTDRIGGVVGSPTNGPTVIPHPPIIYPKAPEIIGPAVAVAGDPEGPLVGGKLIRGGILTRGRLVA